MGRATVRQAIADWFSPPAVPGLNTVYRAEPKLIPGEDYGLSEFSLGDEPGSGALAFVFLEEESETRIAVGGATSGIKHVTYKATLVVLFKSVKPDAIDAVDDHDTLIDNVKDRLRASRTLGQIGSVIWQAGEGQADVHLVSDLPKTDNAGAVFIWSALEFEVVEEVVT